MLVNNVTITSVHLEGRVEIDDAYLSSSEANQLRVKVVGGRAALPTKSKTSHPIPVI